MSTPPKQLQLTKTQQLKHFLTIEGLPKAVLQDILTKTDSFLSVNDQAVKKVPLLRGKTVANLFFEPSTRTRTTFELAAKKLSADVLNINTSQAATRKGELLSDMLANLKAMAIDLFVVRHYHSGAAHFIAEQACPDVAIINAGDGRHAHPTQALLDIYTIQKHKGNLKDCCVAIIGDILHSRVARSQIHALNTLGIGEIRVIAPKTLLPNNIEPLNVTTYNCTKQGLKDVDVIIMLRLQKERMQVGLLPSEQEYYQLYGLSTKALQQAKPDAIVMHPGPINRGVEIASAVADGKQALILNQVRYGIAVRMAILSMTIAGHRYAT